MILRKNKLWRGWYRYASLLILMVLSVLISKYMLSTTLPLKMIGASLFSIGVITGGIMDSLLSPILFFKKDYSCSTCDDFMHKLVKLHSDVSTKTLEASKRYRNHSKPPFSFTDYGVIKYGGNIDAWLKKPGEPSVIFDTDFSEIESRIAATMDLAKIDNHGGEPPKKTSIETTNSSET